LADNISISVEATTHKTCWLHFTDFLRGLCALFNSTLRTRDIMVMLVSIVIQRTVRERYVCVTIDRLALLFLTNVAATNSIKTRIFEVNQSVSIIKYGFNPLIAFNYCISISICAPSKNLIAVVNKL